jgi:hypothetical protein
LGCDIIAVTKISPGTACLRLSFKEEFMDFGLGFAE